VIGGAFQSIDCVRFRVNWEKVNPELLLEVFPGSDGENAGVCFLMKYVFGPLGSTTTFEERESPKNPLFFVVELFRGQVNVQGAGVQKRTAVVTFSAEVRRTGELGMHLSCCQSRGWRRWRGWYRWRRGVRYGQREGISVRGPLSRRSLLKLVDSPGS